MSDFRARHWTRALQLIRRNEQLLGVAHQIDDARMAAMWKLRRRHLLPRASDAESIPDQDAPPTVFWAPEADVIPHFTAMCLAARSLQDAGHPVLFVRCFHDLSRCAAMDSRKLEDPPSKSKLEVTCGSCLLRSVDQLDGWGFPVVSLSSLLDPDEKGRISSAVASAPVDPATFTFDGINVGSLALHDFALATKRSNTHELHGDERRRWAHYAETACRTVVAMRRLMDERTIAGVVQFNDLAGTAAVRLTAEQRHVKSWTLSQASHMSVDRRRIVVMAMPGIKQRHSHSQTWPEWRELCLPPPLVKAGADDLLARFGLFGPQSHIYSKAKSYGLGSAIEKLGLDPAQPVVTAFTSSLDERVATAALLRGLGLPEPAARETFPDQLAWLSALRDFAGDTPSLQFVIRVHPREGVTRREGLSSEHLSRLRATLQRNPANLTIVWPENPISSYDLAECSAAALVSWSSIGVELARLGIPVLATTLGIGPFPDDDFVLAAPSESRYFELLPRLVETVPTMDRIRRAFRWYAMYFLGLSVDVGDVIPRFDYTRFIRPEAPREGPLLARLLTGADDIGQVNLARLRFTQNSITPLNEHGELRRQLQRLVAAILTGADPESDVAQLPVIADGPTVKWRFEGGQRSRVAPAISRLVALLDSDPVDASLPF